MQFAYELMQHKFPKAEAFMKQLEAEAAEEQQKQSGQKRKLDEVEDSDKMDASKDGEKLDNNEPETPKEAETSKQPEAQSNQEQAIDQDLPDINMNVEPKIGPIDEERRYKKVRTYGRCRLRVTNHRLSLSISGTKHILHL